MKSLFLSLLTLFFAMLSHAQSKYEPQIFQPGVISKGDYESHGAFSPSGDTLYFIKTSYDLKLSAICVSYHIKGHWSEPQVAPFSGRFMDADPFVTKDGREIYFMSNRPLKDGDIVKDDTDLWKVTRTTEGWSTPINLGPAINSPSDEYYPTLADNGDLYFGSNRDGGKGGSDIYCARFVNGKYQEPVNLGDSINTKGSEYEAFIAPDESFLIFNSTPNTLKNLDFFISYNHNGVWTVAKKLHEPLSSDAIDWAPKVTRDGKFFYFSSTRSKLPFIPAKAENIEQFNKRLEGPGNGLGDIYVVDFDAVLQMK